MFPSRHLLVSKCFIFYSLIVFVPFRVFSKPCRRTKSVPPPQIHCCFFACCNAAASVSGWETAVSPMTTNHPHREWSGLEATLGSSALSSATVARARATCSVNGKNFPLVFPSSLQRASTPTDSLFLFLLFCPAHVLLSPVQPGRSCRSGFCQHYGPGRELPDTFAANT